MAMLMRRSALALGTLASLGLIGCAPLIGLDDVSGPDACTVAPGAICPASCRPCVHRDDPAMVSLLDGARAQNPEIPAIAAAMILGNDIYIATRGVRDTVSRTPVEETDAFSLWLGSSAVTAALLAKEIDRGVLSWTTTLADAFPELFSAASPPNPYADVTVAQLMSHTSGLPPNSSASQHQLGAAADDYASLPNLADRRYSFTRDAIQDPPVAPPGTGRLIGDGPILAAAILERYAQQPFETLMEKELFQPLAMTHSRWSPDVADHAWSGTGLPSLRIFPSEPMRSPLVGLSMSIEDYARFAYMTLWLPDAPHFYSAAARDAIRSANQGGNLTPAFWTDVENATGGPQFGGWGSTGNDFCLTSLQPNRREALLVLTNYARTTAAGTDCPGASWASGQLSGNAGDWPNVIPPSFPYPSAPTYRPAQGAAMASSVGAAGYEAAKAFDGDYSTWWSAAATVTEATLTVDLPAPAAVSRAVMNEVGYSYVAGTQVLAFGITSFDLVLTSSDGLTTYLAASGAHIGPNLEVRFPQTYTGIAKASLTVRGNALNIAELQLLP